MNTTYNDFLNSFNSFVSHLNISAKSIDPSDFTSGVIKLESSRNASKEAKKAYALVTWHEELGGYPHVSILTHAYGGQLLGVYNGKEDRPNTSNTSNSKIDTKNFLKPKKFNKKKQIKPQQINKTQQFQEKLSVFDNLSKMPNEGLAYFTVNKSIPAEWILDDSSIMQNVRFMDDEWLERYDKRYGREFLLYRTVDIAGNPVAMSRIYFKDSEIKNNKLGFAGSERKSASFFPIGDFVNTTTKVVCESVADGIILANTWDNIAVAVCEYSSNIIATVKALRGQYPADEIIIVADNDERTEEKKCLLDNIGIIKSTEAAIASEGRIVYPENHNDIADLYQAAGIEAVRKLRGDAHEPPNGWHWTLDKIAKFTGTQNIQKNINQAIRQMAWQFPLKSIDTNALNDALSQAGERLGSLFVDKIGYVDSLFAKIIRTQKYTSVIKFSPKRCEQNGIILNRERMEKIDDKWRISSITAKKILTQSCGTQVAIFPMNTGKTYSLIKPFVDNALKQGGCPVLIVPSQSLARSLSIETSLPCYLDVSSGKVKIDDCKGLVICVNSINTPLYAPIIDSCGFVAVDELDHVLRMIHSNTVKKHEKQPLWDKLTSMIQCANKTMVAGADIDQATLRDLSTMNSDINVYYPDKIYETMTNKEITIHTDDNDLKAQLLQRLQQGEKGIFACDNLKLTEAMAKWVQDKGFKVQVINGDNSQSTQVSHFITYINQLINSVDLLIYTPAVPGGVNITQPLDFVFGQYNGECTTTTFSQMLGRARNCKDYHIFSVYRHDAAYTKKLTEQEITAFLQQKVNFSLDVYHKCRSANKVDVLPQSLQLTAFDHSFIDAKDYSIQHKDINNVLQCWSALGVNITHNVVEATEDEKTMAKEEVAEIRQKNEEQKLVEKMVVVDALVDEANKSLQVESTEEVEKRLINEYIHLSGHDKNRPENNGLKLVDTYGLENVINNSEFVVKFDKANGLQKLWNLRNTLTDEQILLNRDLTDIDELPIALHTHRFTQARFNRLFLRKMGMLDDDGELVFPKSSYTAKTVNVVEIMAVCNKHAEAFNVAFAGKLKISNVPIQFIGNWLKMLGLRQVSKKVAGVRVYSIEQERFEFILRSLGT